MRERVYSFGFRVLIRPTKNSKLRLKKMRPLLLGGLEAIIGNEGGVLRSFRRFVVEEAIE